MYTDPKDIINYCRPEVGLLAFVLSGNAPRVSISTQQVRAINLVAALNRDVQEFHGISDVAIIGGGFSGITAAAALQVIGKNVTIYERKRRLVPLQYYNKTRFLHPTSVTWPRTQLYPCTDLPFLNWHCDFSDFVAQTVHQSFEENFAQSENSRIKVNLSHEVTNITCEKSTPIRFLVEYKKIDRARSTVESHQRNHECIIFSMGFNTESQFSEYFSSTYWEDSAIRPIKSSLDRPSVCIVGNGDGALIELFRCFWKHSSIDKIYKTVNRNITLAQKEQLKTYDDKIAAQIRSGADARDVIDAQFSYLKTLLGSDSTISTLREAIEFDTDAVLISPGNSPASSRAQPIHSVLLAFLHREGLFRHVNGIAHHIEYDRMRENYKVISEDGNILIDSMDRVIGRVGYSKGHNKLVTDLFGNDRMVKFDSESGSHFNFANPFNPDIDGLYIHSENNEFMDPHIQQHYLGKKKEEAKHLLFSYLTHCLNYDGIRVDFETDQGLKVFYTNLDNTNSIPERWMGFKVDTIKDSSNPSGKKRGKGNAARSLSALGPGGTSNVLQLHDRLSSRSGSHKSRRYALLSCFVRHKKSPNTKRYAISVKHSFENNTDIIAIKGNNNILIGNINEEIIPHALADKPYTLRKSVVNDIAVINLDTHIHFNNTFFDGTPLLSIKSPTSYSLEEHHPVFIGSEQIGEMSALFVDAEIAINGDYSLITEVFLVKPISKFSRTLATRPSGSMVLDSDGNALGILVGHTDEEWMVVDVEKVLDILGVELVPPSQNANLD